MSNSPKLADLRRRQRERALLAAGAALLVGVLTFVAVPRFAHAGTGGTAGSLAAADAQTANLPPAPLQPADAVLVVKSERKLYLLRNGQPFRSYRVALGLNPEGHKEREGDYRTPEGRYTIVRRNPESDFFLSLGISYPDRDDVQRAKKNGVKPGGSIMIHGLPNVPKRSMAWYNTADWTNGCIALSNDDMLEVWLLTRNNIPIEIRP
jgi:murein L,D-transpeptidase YafK